MADYVVLSKKPDNENWVPNWSDSLADARNEAKIIKEGWPEATVYILQEVFVAENKVVLRAAE